MASIKQHSGTGLQAGLSPFCSSSVFAALLSTGSSSWDEVGRSSWDVNNYLTTAKQLYDLAVSGVIKWVANINRCSAELNPDYLNWTQTASSAAKTSLHCECKLPQKRHPAKASASEWMINAAHLSKSLCTCSIARYLIWFLTSFTHTDSTETHSW